MATICTLWLIHRTEGLQWEWISTMISIGSFGLTQFRIRYFLFYNSRTSSIHSRSRFLVEEGLAFLARMEIFKLSVKNQQHGYFDNSFWLQCGYALMNENRSGMAS